MPTATAAAAASAAPLQLYFAGPLTTAIRLLKEGGVLNPEWLEKALPSTAIKSKAHINQAAVKLDPADIPDMPSVGVSASMYANYYEAIMMAECEWFANKSPPAALGMYIKEAANFGFGPDKSCVDIATLNRFKAIALQPGSIITNGRSHVWRAYGFVNACRQLAPLNATAWEALRAVANDARCASKG
jgi:hypothetical protein